MVQALVGLQTENAMLIGKQQRKRLHNTKGLMRDHRKFKQEGVNKTCLLQLANKRHRNLVDRMLLIRAEESEHCDAIMNLFLSHLFLLIYNFI